MAVAFLQLQYGGSYLPCGWICPQRPNCDFGKYLRIGAGRSLGQGNGNGRRPGMRSPPVCRRAGAGGRHGARYCPAAAGRPDLSGASSDAAEDQVHQASPARSAGRPLLRPVGKAGGVPARGRGPEVPALDAPAPAGAVFLGCFRRAGGIRPPGTGRHLPLCALFGGTALERYRRLCP